MVRAPPGLTVMGPVTRALVMQKLSPAFTTTGPTTSPVRERVQGGGSKGVIVTDRVAGSATTSCTSGPAPCSTSECSTRPASRSTTKTPQEAPERPNRDSTTRSSNVSAFAGFDVPTSA